MVKKTVESTKGNEPLYGKTRNFLDHKDEIVDKKRVIPGELPCKQFEARNSPLTDLWEVKHVRTIYNICIAVLFGLFLNTAACDYLSKGKARLGFNLIFKGFAKFHLLVFIWLCMFLASCVVYFAFKLWATKRVQFTPNSMALKVWDRLWLGSFIFFYPSFMYFCTLATTEFELSIVITLALLMEMTRFLMKSHAFVRSNAPRVLNYKMHADDRVLCPEFSKFLYFSFAPTAVYQDNYPRTKHIRWNYVGGCLLEFSGAILFISFIIERFYIPTFEAYGIKQYTWQEIVIIMLEQTAPAMLMLLSVFYIILHVWQNGFAEMLRFSDRMFYKDWWTSATYERYYRTWNVVVHDWLYTYIYKDFYEIVTPKNKIAAKYMVFFASAAFHDYILGFAFRFYLPILFLQFFGLGTIMSFIKIKQDSIGNIFVWYTLALGTSIDISSYSMEYYARQNCPVENATLSSYFIPQLFICNKQFNFGNIL